MKKIILFLAICYLFFSINVKMNAQNNKKVDFLTEIYLSNSFSMYNGAEWKGLFAFGYTYEPDNFKDIAYGTGLAYNYLLKKTKTSFRAQFEYDITNKDALCWGFVSQSIYRFSIEPCVYADTSKEFSLSLTETLPISKNIKTYIWSRYGTEDKLQTTIQINFRF